MPAPRFFRNLPDTQRLALITLDGVALTVRAQFNPREVQVDKSIAWKEQPTKGANAPDPEFTSGNARSMSLELMFDCFEQPGGTLTQDLATLHQLALAPHPNSTRPVDRMPPVLEVVNGPIPGFRCVIESIAVKTTMFDKWMQPVRATVNLKLKEVLRKSLATDPERRAKQLATNNESVVGYKGVDQQSSADRAAERKKLDDKRHEERAQAQSAAQERMMEEREAQLAKDQQAQARKDAEAAAARKAEEDRKAAEAAAARKAEEDRKDAVARAATESLWAQQHPEESDGTFSQAEVDQYIEDKEARDSATRQQNLKDDGIEPV